MKKYLLIICMMIVMMPTFVSAASLQETYRATILQLISLLTQQIELLKAQLEIQLQVRAERVFGTSKNIKRIPSIDELHPSRFYTGEYTALYATYGTTLAPIDSTKPKNLHQKLWNRLVELAGDEYARAHIQELRIYEDKNFEYDAFVERDSYSNKWIVGLNVYEINLTRENVWKELDTLFLHEIGHMIIDDQNLHDTFASLFWNDEDRSHADRVATMSSGAKRDSIVKNYYSVHPDTFVSEYATTNSLEDSVESFVFFIQNAWRSGSTEKDRKINFFYRYQELVKIRERILGNL